MNAPKQPFLKSISIVWLVPIVALIASGFLVYRQFSKTGPVIEIEFQNGSGIEAGKTPLVHKGVVVGLVQEISFKSGFDGVIVKVELDSGARSLAVEGSQFWLVRPEIGLSGVRGLDTLLSGARLGVRAGNGESAKRFVALERAPRSEGIVPGRNFVLSSPKLGSLHAGSQVYFREMKVGVVEDHRLSDDAAQVLITVRVHEPYDVLVRTDTKFWNSGGLSMKLGLLGGRVESNSLESLVSGGISFATPETAAGRAAEDTVFELVDDPEKSWLKWSRRIELGSSTP
jgi:paraquat-inducible protein B